MQYIIRDPDTFSINMSMKVISHQVSAKVWCINWTSRFIEDILPFIKRASSVLQKRLTLTLTQLPVKTFNRLSINIFCDLVF